MIQSRYYLSIILLLLFTSCIRNSKESQSDTPYDIQYLELDEIKSFNRNCSYEYQIKIPLFQQEVYSILNQFILESVAKYLEIEELENRESILDEEILLSYIQYNTKQSEVDNENTFDNMEFFKNISIDTSFTLYDIIVIEDKRESYTGGAHGAYSTNYTVFDLKNKKLLKASDIFELKDLTKIAYGYFLTERGLSKNQVENEKEGYWFNNNKFHLNDNFSIDSKNLTFIYNTYEIASYAAGQIKVEIPLYKLKSIIKKEYKYIINNE